MARGVKDLREMICVSRLTVIESDEEVFSDEEGRLSRAFSALSADTVNRCSSSRESSASSGSSRQNSFVGNGSPDSGFRTNEPSPEEGTLPAQSHAQSKSAKKRKKKKVQNKGLAMLPAKHELPRQAVLPSVRKSAEGRRGSNSSGDELTTARKESVHNYSKGNFEELLIYLDASVVADWLLHANQVVGELSQWVCTEENFVNFAHFWLSDFPEIQRHEILKLEYEVLLDQLNLAFSVGRETGQIKHKDFVCLLEALYREYPHKLISSKGAHLFLDYLDILTSERTESYKKILADVKCSTHNRQHAQWLLAIRSFALVSSWSAVVTFYRKLLTVDSTILSLPLPAHIATRADINYKRMYQAIRNGYVDVVHFLIKSKKVDARITDTHNKTLVFSAVMYNQPKVLEYLLKVKPTIDPNLACDTGNTPLHAAANNGNVVLVTTLLKTNKVNVNCVNPQTDNATPLHLAAMHGHSNVVEVLLCTKANVQCKMGDLTALDIARDFDHKEVAELIIKSTSA